MRRHALQSSPAPVRKTLDADKKTTGGAARRARGVVPNEQHGYMVVYLRLKGIVPPSTEAMNAAR
jgi:hypothetical protein